MRKKTRLVCPRCKENPDSHGAVIRKGKYYRKCDSKWVKVYFCKVCHYSFTDRTKTENWRLRIKEAMEQVRILICSGVSRRQTGRALHYTRKTVERRFERLGRAATFQLAEFREKLGKKDDVLFDEMESFEHTKLKPLTIPLVVTRERFVVSIGVGRMSAKGPLAKKSRKKYPGWRSERKEITRKVLIESQNNIAENSLITTDEFPTYPGFIREFFPKAKHVAVPGGRGCIAGYEELKRKHWDEMFALNHTAAMLRDHLGTLKRRTWTTTKKKENLESIIHIYAVYHNEYIQRQLERKKLA